MRAKVNFDCNSNVDAPPVRDVKGEEETGSRYFRDTCSLNIRSDEIFQRASLRDIDIIREQIEKWKAFEKAYKGTLYLP